MVTQKNAVEENKNRKNCFKNFQAVDDESTALAVFTYEQVIKMVNFYFDTGALKKMRNEPLSSKLKTRQSGGGDRTK